MRCPNCNKENELELIVPAHALAHADRYDNVCIAASLYCGKPLHIVPVCSYEITAYETESKADD